jgi:hypothetical protein
MGLMVEQVFKRNLKKIFENKIHDFFDSLRENSINTAYNITHISMNDQLHDEIFDSYVYVNTDEYIKIMTYLEKNSTSFDVLLNWNYYDKSLSSFDALAERIVDQGNDCGLEVIYNKEKGINDRIKLKISL